MSGGDTQRVDAPAYATMASRRNDWNSLSAESSFMSPPMAKSIKGMISGMLSFSFWIVTSVASITVLVTKYKSFLFRLSLSLAVCVDDGVSLHW